MSDEDENQWERERGRRKGKEGILVGLSVQAGLILQSMWSLSFGHDRLVEYIAL